MPSCEFPKLGRKKSWKQMNRWERKLFHRKNEARAFKGQPPLPKP